MFNTDIEIQELEIVFTGKSIGTCEASVNFDVDPMHNDEITVNEIVVASYVEDGSDLTLTYRKDDENSALFDALSGEAIKRCSDQIMVEYHEERAA